MLSLLYYAIFSLPLPVVCTLVGTLLLTSIVYFRNVLQPCEDVPKLYYRDSTLARFIIKKAQRLSLPFRLPSWGQNAHVQTILPSCISRPVFHFEREFLQMKDKGVIALDWGITGIRSLDKTSPVLFVLLGLTGDASGVTFLCALAVRKGFRPVVFNKRGHGGSPLTTPKLQSFGDPSDFRQVVKYVRGRFPSSKLTAVGFSAGSGLLISYLGEYGSSDHISAAVSISPGYDAEELFTNRVKQPYNFFLLYLLKRLVSKHARALSKVLDFDRAMQSATIADFEKNLYCQIYGYKDMAEYWERNNPMRDVDDVSTPVLCINSTDDPVCVKEIIPKDIFELYPNFMLLTTDHGGHCGFVEDTNLEPWSEKVAIDYILAVLDFTDRHDSNCRLASFSRMRDITENSK